MDAAKQYIEQADVIFLHAPGLNKTLFLSESRPLQDCAHKVKSIEYKSKKANYAEASDLFTKITEVKIYLK